jgi:coproporphyrinogen III oxidase-like Fe-S oxidoreductase
MGRIDAGASAVTFEESLSDDEEREERIFLGLRRAEGLRASELRELAPDRADEWIERAAESGWIRASGDRVAFTARGFLVSSELIAELF